MTNNSNPKFHTEPMEGYKAFDKNLCCQNNFQYEIGKTYTMDEEPEIRLFNKPSDWNYDDFIASRANYILRKMPTAYIETSWVDSGDMTKKEKEKHPEYRTTGGYLESIKHNKSRQVWWNKLPDKDKQEVMSLPNFDADIFQECTDIDVNAK